MAYGDFINLKQFKTKFGINIQLKKIFDKIKPVEPSDWLKTSLSYRKNVRSTNEKSKSETIVQPILSELVNNNKDFITVFSGVNLSADKEKGLNGECDFIIAKDEKDIEIDSPIFQIVEAKRHDIEFGIPQCAAQMQGAKIFNEKENSEIRCIYGCVTTGDIWQFLKLENNIFFIDNQKYYLNEVDKILGIFQSVIDFYRK